MSDQKNKTDFRDRAEINLNEPYEVQYWTKKWRIPVEELNAAVKATGSKNVGKIEKFITGKEFIPGNQQKMQ
jgi:uncharacterized protein DUF3606